MYQTRKNAVAGKTNQFSRRRSARNSGLRWMAGKSVFSLVERTVLLSIPPKVAPGLAVLERARRADSGALLMGPSSSTCARAAKRSLRGGATPGLGVG